MMIPKLPRHVGILGLVCLFAAASCNQQKKDGEASTDSASADSKKDDSKSDGDSCKKLASKLCGKVGTEDPACESAKITLEVLSDSACATGLKDFKATEAKLKKQGKKCDELIQKICAAVGPDSGSCSMVKEKTKDIPPAHCQTMLDHLDEIVSDLKKQEQANLPLTSDLQAKIAASGAPSFGPADAKVTVVEFSDFECPYCSRAAAVTTQVKEKYSGKVRLIFRQFPLSFHQNAKVAAEAALAAHSQGKFWEFHDKLFQNQRSLDRASLEGYAKELGLDMTKFKAALDSGQNQKQVEADVELGSEVAVQGTPTLFVNGIRIGNPTDFGEVSLAIDAALGG